MKIESILENKAVALGIWNGLPDPYAVEIAAGAGYDWLLIDAEHSPHNFDSILRALQIVAAYPSLAFVRAPSDDAVYLKRVLDLGASNILVPMIETVEQALSLVRAVHYPPLGKRGVGTALARAAQWKRRQDYLHQAKNEITLMVQIESVEGLKNLDAISSLKGVAGVFIGPADLAASMGLLGDSQHPEVKREVKAALKNIRSHGKIAGVMALNEALAQEYIQAGANFVAIAIDSLLLAKVTEGTLKQFQKNIEQDQPDKLDI